MRDMRVALSTLWVFLVLNFLYCDLLALFDPSILRGIVTGDGSVAVQMTPDLLFASAVLMEIPMAMVLLSRLLGQRQARWANVAAAAFMALVQIGSLGVGTPTSYYLFFSAVEVGALGIIALLALRWTDRAPELNPALAA
jgi:hypothetical protein